MNLTKAQLQAVGHLTKEINTGGAERFIVRREKRTSVFQPFASGVISFDEDNKEVGIASISGRVIGCLKDKGLLVEVASDSVHGSLYKASDNLLCNIELLTKGIESFGERPTHDALDSLAERFFCKVTFDRVPRLFKVSRLDGRSFSSPFVDVSLNGVKVTRLTDLTLDDWGDEIADVIKRSELL